MYALGTTHQPGGRNSAEVFSPLIKAGSPLPAVHEKSYTPNGEIVSQVSIPIWEADPDKPLHDPENFQLTTLDVKFPEPLPREDAEFRLKYTYTDEGLLQVRATLAATGEMLLDEEIRDFAHGGCLPAHQIRQDLRELGLTPPLQESRRSKPKTHQPQNASKPSPQDLDRRAKAQTAPPVKPMSGRSFVVDGSNIAWQGKDRTRGEKPSFSRLTDAIRALAKEYPGAQITVFVDPAFRHQIDPSERAALAAAISNEEVIQVPSGTHGKADRSVTELAGRTGATVVTNDNFAELQEEYPWLLDEKRVLGVQHAGGIWMFLPRTPARPRQR